MMRKALLVVAAAVPVAGFHLKQYQRHTAHQPSTVYDAAIIGGGLAGLAVARECAVRGHRVIVLEREDALAAGTSSGNSGLGHTGYDAPEGSLERRLLLRSIRLHPALYRSFGLSHEHVRKCGALVVAWNKEQLKKLPHVLEESRKAGDKEARLILDRMQLREIEPALSTRALGAVFCPYEAVVEPWLVPIGYAESARLHGATLLTQSCVHGAMRLSETENKGGGWALNVRTQRAPSLPCRSAQGEILAPRDEQGTVDDDSSAEFHIRARVVVNCSGLFASEVEKYRQPAKSEDDLRITPRKGQFVVFEAADDKSTPNYVIEAVPSQFTKGVLVWRTVYGNVIVGPTAVDQTSRTDRSTDAVTIAELRQRGSDILPCLKDIPILGTYAGLRPASQHRDYQIQAHARDNWITVAGIRSTGLSAASGIGEYVADLYDSVFVGKPGGKQAGLGVTEATRALLPLPDNVKQNGHVPSLDVLAADFRRSNDGMVEVYGKRHRVTHAISSFGFQSCVGEEV